ncbi:MAG TPA: UDP-N-acetylglucosamine 1-carboxyvinyltransferase [bacterium]|nr:UDP-N-acetylglucosamine 1-carboxyvinyltransferase [bacterium]
MYQYIINGRKKLSGQIDISGDKNTALKIIPSTILSSEKSIISNIPDITDIKIMLEIMEDLGVIITLLDSQKYEFDCSNIHKTVIDPILAKKLRASTVLIGPMLARFGEVTLPHPGGCIIGQRPIDIHLDAFVKLGAKIEYHEDSYTIKASQLSGAKISPHTVSVTGTENIIMAAALSQGTTTIEYAACEPSVIALADFLNSRGAKISGAGSPRIIIEGVDKIIGGQTTTIPDRIEAGTFFILGAVGGGDITINNCDPNHLEVFLSFMDQIGIKYTRDQHQLHVYHSPDIKAKNMVTNPYPGFPTDLQAPYTILMTQTKGLSMIHETIFEGRLNYVEWLNKMGANIVSCDPHRAIVFGPTPLSGKKIVSPDIRAGIALVIAALIAEGQSQIDNIDLVDRGYANLDERLQSLGASVVRHQIN